MTQAQKAPGDAWHQGHNRAVPSNTARQWHSLQLLCRVPLDSQFPHQKDRLARRKMKAQLGVTTSQAFRDKGSSTYPVTTLTPPVFAVARRSRPDRGHRD